MKINNKVKIKTNINNMNYLIIFEDLFIFVFSLASKFKDKGRKCETISKVNRNFLTYFKLKVVLINFIKLDRFFPCFFLYQNNIFNRRQNSIDTEIYEMLGL